MTINTGSARYEGLGKNGKGHGKAKGHGKKKGEEKSLAKCLRHAV